MMNKKRRNGITPQISFYLRKGYSNLKMEQKYHHYPKFRIRQKQKEKFSKQEKIVLKSMPDSQEIEKQFESLIEDIENNAKAVEEKECDIIQDVEKEDDTSLSFVEYLKNLRFTTKVLLFLGFLLVCVMVFFFIELRNMYLVDDVEWKEKTVEYGDVNAEIYKIKDGLDFSVTPLDVYTVGKQTITIQYEHNGTVEEVSEIVKVVDTQSPKISYLTPLVSTTLGVEPDYDKMKLECTDPVDGQVSYTVEPVDVSQIGEHTTTVTAEDINGNQTTEQITVVVKGVGGSKTLEEYRNQRKVMEKEYKERMEKKKKEEEERKRKEKEERERQALIASLGVSHLSESVLQWALDVHKINEELWDTQYDALVLAVIQIESGGTACDLMQASESQGGSAAGHSCGVFKDENEALRAGIPVLKNAMETAGVRHAKDYERIAYALQGYNFGPRYFQEYDRYSLTNAKEFSEIMKKEKGWDVYGAPGYPEYVFKYYNPSYVFQNKEEPKLEIPEPTPQPDVEPPTTPEVDTDTTEPSVPENPQQEESESDGNSSDDPIQDMIEANKK